MRVFYAFFAGFGEGLKHQTSGTPIVRALNPQKPTVNSIKLETGLRPNSAGRPYTLLLRIEAMRFPTFGLLL